MRNKLAECLLIRDENHLLLEHLICNAIAGVERFYIYDNLSAVAVSDFLQANAPDLLPLCEIVRYKGRGNLQMDCYAGLFVGTPRRGGVVCVLRHGRNF